MKVVYEDNHIIIVNKCSGEIVQGDKTGDKPLSDIVKEYIKEKYNKPGNVFLGVVHRLDRPVSGLVVFAKTSKALSRLNDMFRTGDVHKTYWAITKRRDIAPEGTLTDEGRDHGRDAEVVLRGALRRADQHRGDVALVDAREVGVEDGGELLDHALVGRDRQVHELVFHRVVAQQQPLS